MILEDIYSRIYVLNHLSKMVFFAPRGEKMSENIPSMSWKDSPLIRDSCSGTYNLLNPLYATFWSDFRAFVANMGYIWGTCTPVFGQKST